MIYLHVIFLISDVIITPVLIFQQGVNMRKILVVVDMQNDFVDGVLGSKEASEIVDPMCKYLLSFDGEVVFTEDTHFDNYSSTQEGRFLPVPHCIKGTKGHELHPKLQKIAELKQSKIFEKTSFGSLELSAYLKSLWDYRSLHRYMRDLKRPACQSPDPRMPHKAYKRSVCRRKQAKKSKCIGCNAKLPNRIGLIKSAEIFRSPLLSSAPAVTAEKNRCSARIL